MNRISINNQTSFEIDKKNTRKIAFLALRTEKIKGKEISIVFLEKSEIRKLNKKYRNLDKATDVLSFEGEKNDSFLGEIAISPETVKQRSEISFDKSLACVLIHGILHLAGYDHANPRERRIMRQQENFLLKKAI